MNNSTHGDEAEVLAHGEPWTDDALALLLKRCKSLPLRLLASAHGRSITAVLFQMLKSGRLELSYGKGSNLPKGALVGFEVVFGGPRFQLAQPEYTDRQEMELQKVLDHSRPTLVKLVNSSTASPISVFLWLFHSHKLVLNDGYDLGVGDQFFAVAFLLPPIPYRPSMLDSDNSMVTIEEVMEGGSVSFMARKHNPKTEQRSIVDRDRDLSKDPTEVWGAVCNHELELEQQHELAEYREDVFHRRGI